MSLKDEIQELMQEASSGDLDAKALDDITAALNKQLGIGPGAKPKVKPKLTPQQLMEAQWEPRATILAIDVRKCDSCGEEHSIPFGFFLEQVHKVVFEDRKLTQIHQCVNSMPELYKALPSRLEVTHSTIGFCNLCFGERESLSHPFYSHVPTHSEPQADVKVVSTSEVHSETNDHAGYDQAGSHTDLREIQGEDGSGIDG